MFDIELIKVKLQAYYLYCINLLKIINIYAYQI